jgi:TolB-like protein
VSELSHAVFLSYASQDAEAARKICEALRAAGIEVWFDQSELRGGDAWDQSIRKQIKTCALFLPVISHNTHDRREGYFRLEWKLAVDRCHLMDAGMTFLLPIVIDDTAEEDERVPERFREVQWTRLPSGITPPAFVERVRHLLAGEFVQDPPRSASAGVRVLAPSTSPNAGLASPHSKAALTVMIAVVVLALGYLVASRLVLSKRTTEVAAAPGVRSVPALAAAPIAVFKPPPHSIAVLPFVNLSGDKEQEYFSDGLTEELLNSLAEINELQVAARTSAFSFKGQDNDIGTIARKLNVGAVLEGSVRRSAHTIRITAQLINAVTGFHLWSKTYDRDLGDVLKLQIEIATAVAGALKVTLLGDVAAKVELGGTRNPAAFDAYLRGAKAFSSRHDAQDVPTAMAAYTEAIRLDPHYALAFAARSIALIAYADEVATGASATAYYGKAQNDARQALALAPGNAQVLRVSSGYASYMGHADAALAAARRAVVLDPLSRTSHDALGAALYAAHRYEEASVAFANVVSLEPGFNPAYGDLGLSYYGFGDLPKARASCEMKPDYWYGQQCLAVIYDKLGRHADAQAELSRMTASLGNAAAYQYATIHAQWGNRVQALAWLERALRLRDAGLINLKTDPLLDPLRQEPRFQAIERELKFPD